MGFIHTFFAESDGSASSRRLDANICVGKNAFQIGIFALRIVTYLRYEQRQRSPYNWTHLLEAYAHRATPF